MTDKKQLDPITPEILEAIDFSAPIEQGAGFGQFNGTLEEWEELLTN